MSKDVGEIAKTKKASEDMGEKVKTERATKKSVFEMNWDEFVEYMNSEDVEKRWEKAMEEAKERELEAKKTARDFWVIKS